MIREGEWTQLLCRGLFTTAERRRRVGVQWVVISGRTKKALAEKKRLGLTLGRGENLTSVTIEEGRGSGNIRPARTRTTAERRRWLTPWGRLGRVTAIANTLNDYAFLTRRDNEFRPV